MNNYITFCAVLRNEEINARRILDIGSKLCRRMVIAVQESDDNTLKICQDYPATIIQRPSESPEESRDFIMEQVKTPWTFWLDADEFPSLSVINTIERFEPWLIAGSDAMSFVRINYVNGITVTGGQDKDKQFRLLKSDVRWNPKQQGRRIHIYPQVKNPIHSDKEIYHYRTLEKIKRQTERWNELEKSTQKACNDYVTKIEEELCRNSQ